MAVVINVLSTFSDAGLKAAQKELDDFSKKTQTKLGKFGDAAGKVALGIGAGFAAAGAGLFAVGQSFDEAFDSIRVGTGATGDALSGLQNDFKAVVSAVPASFGDASTAITTLNQRLGLTGQPLQQLSQQMLELSRITGTELNANVESVAKVFQNFGVTAGDQSGKLDVLFRASQQSGVSVQALAETMSGAGVVLRQVGLNFDQSAAFIATLAKAGVDASDVMPALSRTLATAAKNGKDASVVFSETFNTIKNAKSDTDAAGVALEVFGAKAGPRLAAMIREGKLSFEEMQQAIVSGSDTIIGAGADTEDFAEKFTRMKNRIMVAVEPLASKVFGAIGEAMDKLGPKIEQLTNWFKENEDKAKLLAGVLGGVMVIAIGAYTVAMAKAAVMTIAATWPILAVIAAVTAVVAAIYLVWTNWDKIWNWIKDHPAIAAIIAVLAAPIAAMVLLIGAIKYLWENWHWIWDAIKNFTLDVWNSYIKPVWDAIYSFIETYLVPWFKFLWDVAGQVWTWISARISEVWNNVIKPIWDVLIFYVENVLIPGFGYLKDIIVTAFNIAVDVISSAWSNISRIFDFIKGGISLLINVFGSIKDGISNAFSTIYDIITWPFKTAFNFIADAWNNTVGKLEFTMPDWVPLIGGKGFKMPTIPKFHQGGIVPGPAGSETLALLEGGEMILTRGQVQAMANTPTGSNVSVVINTVAGNPIEIERIVIDAIARANRRGMTTLTP
jgi:TP901 family phage tail tape measure protein